MRLSVRPRPSRLVPLVAAAAVALVACSGGGSPSPTSSTNGAKPSIDELKSGNQAMSLLSSDSAMSPGQSYFSFALTTQDTGALIEGASPQVYLAQDTTSPAQGPFPATWYAFAPASEFNDTSPRSQLTGTYATQVDVNAVGNWAVVAVVDQNGAKLVGQGTITVTDQPIPAQIGTKAISVKTPVATTEEQAREIDTRDPPSPLHYISLDDALKNGKPTVVVFATPLLCESMLCGPVVDEVLLVYQSIGADTANFIHVEEFLPGPDHVPPPATLENVSPGFKAWGFQTEPWVIVIDKGGIIRARFEGPVTAAIIEQALQPLL
jgi:hypothetical protein